VALGSVTGPSLDAAELDELVELDDDRGVDEPLAPEPLLAVADGASLITVTWRRTTMTGGGVADGT
jgi:hypothetical protein